MLRIVFALVVALLMVSRPADACGGFLAPRVPPGQTSAPDLHSDGSRVAIVRDGLRTVVSLSMRYRGPPEDFALVVPVPVVLAREQVRTVGSDVFERLDLLTRPQLVEQWEDYPCIEKEVVEEYADAKEGGTGTRAKGEEGSMGGPRVAPVRIEAAFSVDEYDIVILGATDSLALEKWLKDAGYALPANVEPFLRPYVAAGSKFFVAKVDSSKIDLSWGRAILSPLRFHFDSEAFSLPIRLGLANVEGDQDLTVWVLARGTRYEIANYDNSIIPTNRRLVEGARDRFDAFYDRLFQDTLAKHPKSIVTEYAGADSCIECGLSWEPRMVRELGGDVIPEARPSDKEFVVTRMHARYGASFAEDFFFRPAPPLEGGNESIDSGDLPSADGRVGSSENHFQARYFVRHPWHDEVDCRDPTFGMWRGQDTGGGDPKKTAMRMNASLEDFTFRNEEPHRSRSLYSILEWLHPYDAAVVLPATITLAIAIAVLVLLARRWRTPVWKPVVLAIVLALLPGLLAITRTSWRSVQMTPLATVQLALYVVAAALVTAIATARSTGRDPPKGVAAAVALLPLLVSLVAFHMAVVRLDFWSVDNAQAGRILAEGEGEACEGILLGGCASALLLGVVAWSVVFSRREGEGEGSASRSLAPAQWAIAIALGIAANVFAYAMTSRDTRWVPVLAIPAFLFGLFLTWRARKLDGDRVLALAMTWMLAMGCIALATILSVRASGLQAITGESIDPTQRGRIVDSMFHDIGALSWRLALATVLSVLAPLWLALRNAPRLLGRAVVPSLAVLTTCFGIWWAAHRTLRGFYTEHEPPIDARASIADMDPVEMVGGYDLRLDKKLEGPALLASASGALLASPNMATAPTPFDDAIFARMATDALHDPSDPLLVVDRSLRMDRLDAALEPMLRRRHTAFRLLLGHRNPHGAGLYSSVVDGPDLRASVPLEWKRKVTRDPAREKDSEGTPGAIAIRIDGDQLVAVPLLGARGRYRRLGNVHEARFARDTIPSFAALSRGRINEYVLHVTRDMPASDLAKLVLSLEDHPPPPRGWGMPPDLSWDSAHPSPRFVVTMDGFE